MRSALQHRLALELELRAAVLQDLEAPILNDNRITDNPGGVLGKCGIKDLDRAVVRKTTGLVAEIPVGKGEQKRPSYHDSAGTSGLVRQARRRVIERRPGADQVHPGQILDVDLDQADPFSSGGDDPVVGDQGHSGSACRTLQGTRQALSARHIDRALVRHVSDNGGGRGVVLLGIENHLLAVTDVTSQGGRPAEVQLAGTGAREVHGRVVGEHRMAGDRPLPLGEASLEYVELPVVLYFPGFVHEGAGRLSLKNRVRTLRDHNLRGGGRVGEDGVVVEPRRDGVEVHLSPVLDGELSDRTVSGPHRRHVSPINELGVRETR